MKKARDTVDIQGQSLFPQALPLSSSFYLVDFIQALFLPGLQQPKVFSS